MVIFLFLIGIVLIKELIEKIAGKWGYLIICCIAFTAIYGFSSELMGLNDRELVYSHVFDLCCRAQTFPELLDLADSRITSGTMFYIITWLISRFTLDYHIYLFVIGFFFNAAVTYFVGKYSNDPRLSFMVYLALIYPLSFTIVRQCTAMIFLIIAIDMIYRKKSIWAYLFIFIALSIHMSAVILLIMVLLSKIKFHKLALLLVPVGILLGLYGGNYIFNFLQFIVTDETYSTRYAVTNGKGMALTAILIRLMILVFLVVLSTVNREWFSKEEIHKINHRGQKLNHKRIRIKLGDHEWIHDNQKALLIEPDIFLWSSLISTVLVSMINVLGEFQRMAAYFDLSLMVSIPRAVGTLKKKDGIIVTIVIMTLLIIYFLGFQLDNWNIRQYHFFWE